MFSIPTNQTPRLWCNQSTQKPPKQAIYCQTANAQSILKSAYQNIATIWTGDFQTAKQVLNAIKKQLRAKQHKMPSETPHDIQTAFHQHRLKQAQQSRLINMLAIEIQPNFTLTLPRAPDLHEVFLSIFEQPNQQTFLLPLNQLLGFIGAYQWYQKGIEIAALDGKIHVPYGVFSPLRGEYLDLIMQAKWQPHFQTAFDIGTGSGILAMLLAKRGASNIIATDTNPRAIACAQVNIEQHGLQDKILIQNKDLFPDSKADLIVCNPPWLPAKPTSAIETALYDPDHSMLKAFLHGVGAHLNDKGEAWLIMSDLAEHLHLRTPDFLAHAFQTASLRVVETLQTQPKHSKARDTTDPLAFARNHEQTYLYRLEKL